MNIHILTLFPGMFSSVFSESILKRGRASGRLRIDIHDIRKYSLNRHKKVDDKPFGGGPGMVLQCQPVIDALQSIKRACPKARAVLMGPRGSVLNQDLCNNLARQESLILVCGHYEGVDERIRDYVSDEISIGDYVLTGGELAAMVVIDAVARLVPGVLGDLGSNTDESFISGLLEYPHYTRPADYKGKKVPAVLLSGNHSAIDKWRKFESIRKTINQRPDMIKHMAQLDITAGA
ncbi:MAG: tRNA (guanosine(37)-N1)-methyltransferase TrmD [Candidatus Omnitrophica bacterium]|nr:tRNA (guanosine(37)-N1)-methyltransferase TrmD [Candidatus Omnitrophota bacterium]